MVQNIDKGYFSMTISVSPNYFQKLLDLQAKNHRIYSWQDVGSALGMSRQAAQHLFMSPPTENSFVKYSTLSKLLAFFRAEGLDITVADLFTVDTPASGPS